MDSLHVRSSRSIAGLVGFHPSFCEPDGRRQLPPDRDFMSSFAADRTAVRTNRENCSLPSRRAMIARSIRLHPIGLRVE
jgi:hypothetical protein